MNQWWNDYLGLPYVANGRARSGLDCWGLVRLVHAEVFGNDLPSFADRYIVSERDKTAELIALNKEAWTKVEVAQTGDVALFRILGEASHVGIITRPGYFLHVREGQDSVIERLDSAAWKHRLVGVYRYAESTSICVSSVPHPLRTVRLDTVVPAGTTLAEMATAIRAQADVDTSLPDNAAILIDGEYIPRSEWETLIPTVGQRVKYRALVRGSGVGRMVGMVALMAFAWWAAPLLVGALGGAAATATTAGIGFMGLSYGASIAIAQGAINIAGSLLLNAIFPVRSATAADNSPRSMNLLQGGSNQLNRYGAIPVVLGRMRYTPPLAAEAYVESGSSKSYLYMAVLWGYGPLQISDLRIGTTPIDTYEEIEYETLNGWDDTAEDKARFNSLYGRDVTQEVVNVKLTEDVPVERTLLEEVDRIKVTFNFPQGLYAVDPTYGDEYSRRVWVSIKIRPAGSGSYAEVAQTIHSRVVNLSSAYYNVDNDAELEPVYRWTRFSLDKYNNVITRTGSLTQSAYAEPSGTLLARLRAETYGQDTTYDRLPALGAGEEALWDVCVYGSTVYAAIDRRGAEGYGSVTGCALTTYGLKATVAAGTIMRSQTESFVIEKKIKRAFCVSSEFYVPRGQYDVMVTRTTGTPGGDNTTYDDCYLYTITGYANNKPIVPPASMAMTAIRVRATDQLNGTIDGITGTVQAICPDWDRTTGTWIKRPTRNPASLLRHVLQHPGNARRVPDSQINLTALADWHEFCRVNGFMFDFVLTGQVSLDDQLRDICAAGRASPTRVDGKHTVIIDRPRSQYAQFFTPHNSWGFESTKALPVIPHGFRVTFNNAARGYQVDERIVYDDDYSASNATLFEALQLPGVSDEKIVHKHARFHLAQIKLRPEQYTLNVDWEHLVCTRGDLVKVTHDVPMWGLGSARIKEFVDGTHLRFDEDFAMDAGAAYTLRIRLENGTSITRNIVPATVDGHYDTLTLASSVTSTQGKAGNLAMFGLLNAESVDAIVQSVEPSENMCARLTLVDYSPAIYDSDSEGIPAFNSQITLPPTLLLPTVTQIPTITGVVSDERAMTRLSVGKYQYGMRVGFANPASLPKAVTHVEGQIEWSEDDTTDWQTSQLVAVAMGAVTFNDVRAGDDYKFRLRYVDKDGRTGPWTVVRTHTVVGKVNPPSTATGLTVAVSGTKLLLDWAANPEPDVEQYEVRAENANWGQAGYLFRGAASQCLIMPPAAGESKTFYVKAIDGGKLYSSTAASVSYTYAAPSAPSSLTYSFHDTSTTTATVTLDWSDVVSAFGTKDYLVSWGETTKAVGSSTIKLRVDWTGSRTFSVQTRDQRGSVSAAKSITITLQLPGTPPAPKQDITQGNGMLLLVLDWADAAKGSLPVGGYEIRSADSGWGGSGYLYRGSASQATIANVLSKLAQTWYLKSYDTDGRYCATARTFVVEEPGVPPSVVGLAVKPSGTRLALDWSDSSALDVTRYEVRTEDADWGSAGGSRVYYGGSSNCYFSPTETGTYTFYVKARDAVGRWSVSAASVSYTYAVPSAPASITASFADTSTTTATVTLDWPDVVPPFGLSHYTVSYGSVTKTVKASTIVLPADWVGDRTYTVWTVDALGNASSGMSKSITKLRPAKPTGVRASVIDNTVMLYWTLPARTTLPVSHALLKKGATWDAASGIGRKDGAFTTINEPTGGTFTYWVATVDTDGYESEPVSVTVKVSEPPDFVFHGSFESALGGTLSAAMTSAEGIVIPVNLTETFEQHFSTRGWTTLKSQVDAGYPRFINPAPSTGNYSETFDFGTILSSSKITVAWSGPIFGTPVVTPKIELSDGSGWVVHDGVSEVFGTNFRYVRVTLTVGSSGADMLVLTGVSVSCSAKQQTDSGMVSCNLADTNGTLVNFSKTFLNVASITVSPNSTVPLTPVYNFQNAVLSGSYSVASNVATVNVAAHDLVVGQKVRLNFTSGAAAPITAIVTEVVDANRFKASVTSPNTSGALSIYPQGIRVYLFKTDGSRVSGTVSWSIRGY